MYIISIILIITLLYNGYIIIKYKKLPESLSETSYIMGGNKRYLFTGYCFLICILILPVLLDITPIAFQVIPFIFCGGLIFAGVSPLFKEGLDKIVHYSSAIIAFLAFIIYSIFCIPWYFSICYIIILSILCIWKYNNYVYWAEQLALLDICIYIILTLC